jgi:tripartite-type tricarboxylate transporter receptor subunit TctC
MKVPWHPTKDFAGVAMVGQVPNLVVIPATLEPRTLREFVAYAKARPGQLNFANGGNGTSPTLGVEMLKKHAGLQMTSVGYKGYPPVIPDMIAGRIEFSMVPFAVAAPHVKSGKLRALAIASNSRSRLLPDVPTMAEAGFADSPVISWYAIFAPAGTPRPVIQRLNAEFAKALADTEVQGRIESLGGATLPTGSPAEVDALLAAEADRWAKFIKESGLKLE